MTALPRLTIAQALTHYIHQREAIDRARDQQRADKQGAFVGEGTPHDAASKAGCSASGYSGTGVEAGVAGSIPAQSTKCTWADLQAEHAEFRRRWRAEAITPEYHARRAEQERQREINNAAWAEFAAAGGPVARNLRIALKREGK